jgi:16S rRNA G966 N2-methylase RsmD
MVETNLAVLGLSDFGDVHRGDATASLVFLRSQSVDIIFLGPPYKDEQKRPLALTVPTLSRIEEAGLAGPQTVVVGQRHAKESLKGLSPRWEQTRENKYGDTLLTFYRWKP